MSCKVLPPGGETVSIPVSRNYYETTLGAGLRLVQAGPCDAGNTCIGVEQVGQGGCMAPIGCVRHVPNAKYVMHVE